MLREAVRDELSDEVYAGGKRGFFAPPAAAGDGLVALLRGLVDDSAMRDNPIYEPAAVRRFLDELDDRPAERQADSDRLLHLVTATSLLTTEFGMTADTGPTLGGSRG